MNTYVKALVLGMMAGMRSMSAPSTMADYIAKKSPGGFDRFAWEGLFSRPAVGVWRALAVGEMGGDKAPKAPARVAPVPLTARAVSGGVSAASICAAEGRPAVVGVAIGVAAAVGSSFLFYNLRKMAGERFRVPDPMIGAVEDAAVVALRSAVLS